MDERLYDTLAEALLQAERHSTPVTPFTTEYPDLTPADAYRIQERVVEKRLAQGDKIVGYKVGLTSRAMQEMLGVDEPDYGPILASMLLEDGAQIRTPQLIQPRVEAEIAFILAEPLAGPGVTALDVLRASAGVVAAVEVIDSRIADWQIKLPDTIADLASSARVVFASRLIPVDGMDLGLVGVVLMRNGEVSASGAGAAALGNPANAAAWAANTLAQFGVTLEAGHLIMPGALHAAIPASQGDTFHAVFDRLGNVTVRFV